jgi:hypothetical protein
MKLIDNLITLALNNERTGIVLLDNIIIDGLGLSRMVTVAELNEIKNYSKIVINKEMEEFFKKVA